MTLDLNFIWKVAAALVCASLISLGLTPFVKMLAQRVGAVDVPKDERRMHKVPIPRMGGMAIFLGFLVAALIFVPMVERIDTRLQGILLGSVLILVLGVLDDIITLPALAKFPVQFIAAIIVVLHGCRIDQIFGWQLPAWLSYCGSVFWIVAMTNAINFIDGLDGLAAGVSAISAGAMLVVALLLVPQGNSMVCAILLAAVVGGCVGFIPYNFNPAKIFMGDTGSNFLGFILASVSIYGLFKTYAFISFAVPFLVLGLPIFDICFAVIRRVAHGQSPMHADRGHFHHRLIDMGFSQKQTVAIAYLLTAILGLAAVTLTGRRFVRVLIIAGALAVMVIIGFVLVFNRHHHDIELQHEKEKEEQHEED